MKQLAFAIVLLAGCGGSVVEQSSSGDGGSTATATATTSDVATAVVGTTSAPSSSSGEGASSGDGGSSVDVATVGTGGSSGDGGSSVDVATVGTGGSSGEGGSSSTGTPPIQCGMEECDADTEVCCATFNGATCIGADDPCEGATATCSSAAQCDDGEVCCGTFGGGSGSASCTSDPCGEDMNSIQLCESDAECPPDKPCVMAPFGNAMVCDPGFGG